MTELEAVFLLDVDNTLLDGDRVVVDSHNCVKQQKQQLGSACARRYWAIFDRLRKAPGYVDYLGALQHYRLELEKGDATVFVRKGHYALDSKIIAAQPTADITIECVGDLVTLNHSHLVPPPKHR